MELSERTGRLSKSELLGLYEGLLLPRMIEEKMLILLRQGRISKWFSGIGQEGIAVGATAALHEDEYVLPLHRNLGVFTQRNVPLDRLFKQFQGKAGGFSKGRERSFHFGTLEHHIVGMISHLGPQLALADGIALGAKLAKEKKVTMAFTGDGGTSEGDFHEALNVAAVWNLPVIFIVENNSWGLSTPSKEQFACEQLSSRAAGYGMEGITIDGNDVVEVYSTIKKLAKSIRKKPRPVLVECMTFRMRGHEEASGTKYYPEGLQDEWAKKDPLSNFEDYLLGEGILVQEDIDRLRKNNKQLIESGLDLAFAEEAIESSVENELNDVYAPHDQVVFQPSDNKKNIRLIDAISDGLREGMRKYPNSVIMGQDIAEYGGVFKITDGFLEEFGKDRVRNTPICESAIVSAALGLSVKGYKAIMEMQFADFVSSGFNPVVNNLAKIHYRWGQNADVVIRMPTGAGVGAGPFHSQSNEAWFTHVPGLKVVYPANPVDAKGLLLAAIEDPNPVMYFEHKALYRSQYADVPEGYYTTEIGKAALVKEGTDCSIISYGMGVKWALDYLEANPEISADVLDLRSLVPLDKEAIFETVRKTGKVLILHEDTGFGGIGGEISSLISENCFESLDAPIVRCTSLDTPVPFAQNLEKQFLANHTLANKLNQLLNY